MSVEYQCATGIVWVSGVGEGFLLPLPTWMPVAGNQLRSAQLIKYASRTALSPAQTAALWLLPSGLGGRDWPIASLGWFDHFGPASSLSRSSHCSSLSVTFSF